MPVLWNVGDVARRFPFRLPNRLSLSRQGLPTIAHRFNGGRAIPTCRQVPSGTTDPGHYQRTEEAACCLGATFCRPCRGCAHERRVVPTAEAVGGFRVSLAGQREVSDLIVLWRHVICWSFSPRCWEPTGLPIVFTALATPSQGRQNLMPRIDGVLLLFFPKPMACRPDEHIFQRGLAQRDRPDLVREFTREGVDQLGPLGRFNTELSPEQLGGEVE